MLLLMAEFAGQPQCGAGCVCPIAGGQVARVGSLEGTDDIGQASGPPGCLAKTFKILGSERDGRVRLEEAVISLAPCMTREGLSGVVKCLVGDLRHCILARTAPVYSGPPAPRDFAPALVRNLDARAIDRMMR